MIPNHKPMLIAVLLLALAAPVCAVDTHHQPGKAAVFKKVIKTNGIAGSIIGTAASKLVPPGSTGAAPYFYPTDRQEEENIRVYKSASKGVVNIAPVASAENYILNNAPPQGFGSGIIISDDGVILTNYHVVDNAEHVRVTFFDGSSLHGLVIGADQQTELAVIKVTPPKDFKLTVIPFGDSSRLEVGRRVLVIGNPFSFDRTLTGGIVSSLGRTMMTEQGRLIKGIIQTDAAINPGNSGGPLLDTQGRVVGVTTAIFSKSGQSSGIGFAIPINIAKNVVPQLLEHRRVLRPELGVEATPAGEVGLRVLSVTKGSAADKAGLSGPRIVLYDIGGGLALQKPDWAFADIILAVDGQPTNAVDSLMAYIESKKPNQVVTLTIIRSGRVVKIPVKLIVPESN
jgi:S1-C subfamily serine protease